MPSHTARTIAAGSSAGSASKELLRFLTCGSVDDGKSTLIGRLLYDGGLILEDQLKAIASDSLVYGTVGDDIDLALLVDGLEIERQQGITIDVAYRYFSTGNRSFIVADTPGHEQYTRNMATGASNADLAVVLIDARKGVLPQTKRHSYICSLFGIRHIVLAVNKIDLVEFDETTFNRVARDFHGFASTLGFETVQAIPLSARYGDNIMKRSARMPWYSGRTLIEALEGTEVKAKQNEAPFRFPVQRVSRPDHEFRGYAGVIVSGKMQVGDPIVSTVSGKASSVERIVTANGELNEAGAGDSVTLCLAHEIDIARGDVLCHPDARADVADQFAAHVIAMSETPLLAGRSYLMRIGNRWTPASITSIKHKVDVKTLNKLAARELHLNDIAVCNFSTATLVAFDSYSENRATGSFILVDRSTNDTVAAGMIQFGLRRATNIHVENLMVDKSRRSALMGQKPTLLWFTGLSGSGKSTIAKLLEKRLHDEGRHTYVLDGDNVRHGINRDLGFTDADRVENIRRIGEIAKLFLDAGIIVLCSFISPFRAERDLVRDMVEPGEFVEIFVDAPLEDCIRRDPKGLYAKALRGDIPNFTGLDSPYETPRYPAIHLETSNASPDELVARILMRLRDGDRL